MDLSAPEIRVLGCLIEKQRTTPDAYPLTLNALRLACNQATNREPVVAYDEATVRDAATKLERRRLARFTSGYGSRAAKYRHLLSEQLALPTGELALLAILMLRGAQTAAELRSRSARLHSFANAAAVDEALDQLRGRGLAIQLARRPGEREQRYAHQIGEDAQVIERAQRYAHQIGEDAPVTAQKSEGLPSEGLDQRVDRLERQVAELREALGRVEATRASS